MGSKKPAPTPKPTPIKKADDLYKMIRRSVQGKKSGSGVRVKI